MSLEDSKELIYALNGRQTVVMHGHKHKFFRRVEGGGIQVLGATALAEPEQQAEKKAVYGYRVDITIDQPSPDGSGIVIKSQRVPIADENGLCE